MCLNFFKQKGEKMKSCVQIYIACSRYREIEEGKTLTYDIQLSQKYLKQHFTKSKPQAIGQCRKILVTVMEFALHLYCPSMFACRWQQLAQQSCRSHYHTAMSEKRPNGRNLSLPVKCDIEFFYMQYKSDLQGWAPYSKENE